MWHQDGYCRFGTVIRRDTVGVAPEGLLLHSKFASDVFGGVLTSYGKDTSSEP